MKLTMRILLPAVILIIPSLIFPFHHNKNDKISASSFAFENHGNNKEIQSVLNIDMDTRENLKKTVYMLSGDIGSRGYLQTDALERTVNYIASELKHYGYDVLFQPYEFEGRIYKNIYAEIRGKKTPEKILIIGAHYDTVTGTPGADDNASGIAGLLELARLLHNQTFDKTIRFVAFALEEPPFFRSKFMGSYVYARSIKESGEDIEGMICLEMIGYFTDKPKSQFFPLPIFKLMYPDKGNFIIFVSNLRSKNFLNRVKHTFKKNTDLPVESISTLSIIPGIDFSDHRSFWEFDYNALMVTDSAFYRNPNYHNIGDTPETLDYESMSKVVSGLKSAIEELAGD